MPVAEWVCEGCGVHVTGFGIAEPPRHRFCATCAWACEFLDPTKPEWDVVTRVTSRQHDTQRACAFMLNVS